MDNLKQQQQQQRQQNHKANNNSVCNSSNICLCSIKSTKLQQHNSNMNQIKNSQKVENVSSEPTQKQLRQQQQSHDEQVNDQGQQLDESHCTVTSGTTGIVHAVEVDHQLIEASPPADQLAARGRMTDLGWATAPLKGRHQTCTLQSVAPSTQLWRERLVQTCHNNAPLV